MKHPQRHLRPAPPLRSERGSSLVEMMMALVFLSIGLLGVAQMIPVGMNEVSQARLRTKAVQAAQEILESVRSHDFEDVELAAGSYAQTVGQYTVSWTISDDNPVPGSKRVDVTASWATMNGSRSTRLKTYVSPR